MDAECGRDQVKHWRFVGELLSREVSKLLKFAALVVPLHARPVIEPLERQVEIFVGFEFEDGEAAGLSNSEEIDHGAIARRKRGHLRVDAISVELRVDDGDVAADDRFEPAL